MANLRPVANLQVEVAFLHHGRAGDHAEDGDAQACVGEADGPGAQPRALQQA
ncbi:MAG: Uncharacterised protein [Rhodospirillaceae bacterium]|nr:MAG: Uncharacterised protein [Rhodospirillaceae bacterium]